MTPRPPLSLGKVTIVKTAIFPPFFTEIIAFPDILLLGPTIFSMTPLWGFTMHIAYVWMLGRSGTGRDDPVFPSVWLEDDKDGSILDSKYLP